MKRRKAIKEYSYAQEGLQSLLINFLSILFTITIISAFFIYKIKDTHTLAALAVLLLYFPLAAILLKLLQTQQKKRNDNSRLRIYNNGDIRVTYYSYSDLGISFIDFNVNSKYITKVVEDEVALAGLVLIIYYYDHILKEEKWYSLARDNFTKNEDYIDFAKYLAAITKN